MAALAGSALIGLLACTEPPTEAQPTEEPTVAPADPNSVVTTAGPVRGETTDGRRVFRGIPYAAPPVGDLRWRAPQPVAAWEQPRDSLAFGTPCWQPRIEGFYDRGPIERSEDCLYLNVWTRGAAGDDLPVMVWIHGGALQIGHGHLPIYDGGALTEQGVVLVSINYRLGVMGFLAHEELSAESPRGVSGNYGLLDQIAALTWVRDNIGAFGGDPGNVTIFGESAGSWSVCHLYASSLAKGLFHRAIGQSGGCFAPHPALDAAEAAGASLAELVEAPDVATMRTMPAEAIYAKIEEARWASGIGLVNVDGEVFVEPAESVAAGQHNRVPVLLGSTANEGTTLFADMEAVDEATWRENVAAAWGDQAEDILSAYAEDAAAGPNTARQRILSDQYFAWQMRTWARQHTAHGDPAWLYHFAHVPDLGGEHGTSLGAFHAAEIPYAFGNPHLGFGDEGQALEPRPSDLEVARLMSGYWTNFAKTGDPNGEGLPSWPAYAAATDLALEISAEPTVVAELRKAKLDIMDRFYATRRPTDDGEQE